MVQSYLKKVGHRTFAANKKGEIENFFRIFPPLSHFLLQRRRIATSGLQKNSSFYGYGRWPMAMAFDHQPSTHQRLNE